MTKKSLPTPLKVKLNVRRRVVRRVAKVEKYFVQVQMEQGWQRDEHA